MIAFFLITFIPTLLLYILLPKVGIKFKSNYLNIGFSWFVGLFAFSFLVFFLAHFFTHISPLALLWATFSGLFIMVSLLFLYPSYIEKTMSLSTIKAVNRAMSTKDTLVVLACFLFPYFFFAPHLQTQGTQIYQSPAYWDFHWHAAVIGNFVYGNNFPPQNESFAGAPMTYHYFGDFVIAMYQSIGLTMAQAITYVSILALFFLFIIMIGISEEFFESRKIGYLAILFTVTSSSLRFVSDFEAMQGLSIFQAIGQILANSSEPFNFSFVAERSMSEYSGTMFNLFYYLEERHMILGFVYLLLSIVVMYKRHVWSKPLLFISGLLLGGFFFWHIYISFMVLVALLVLLCIDKDRQKTLLLLGGFLIAFVPQYAFIKLALANPAWFIQESMTYPRFNPTFATQDVKEGPLHMLEMIVDYFWFAYSVKIIFFFIGIVMLWRRNARLAKVFIAVIVPAFIMVNTLEIGPAGTAENHKFLVPMTLTINLITGISIYLLFFKKRTFQRVAWGCVFLFFLTISGIIELMPFLNSKPSTLYTNYGQGSLVHAIRNNSSPNDVFVGKDVKDIHFAGRKIFVGDSAGPAASLNKAQRLRIESDIYHAEKLSDLCKITKDTIINYVEFAEENKINLDLKTIGMFSAVDAKGKRVLFVNVKSSCR